MARALECGVRYSIAALVFATGLTLSPRAWVTDVPHVEPALVPVNTLQDPQKCLWCETPASDCDRPVPEQRKSIWLSPDAPVPASERMAPCPRVDEAERPRA